MKNTKLAGFALALLMTALTSTSAHAVKISGRGDTGGYGAAGCGLGSIVFPENNKLQILAATTNGTFGSQTFGITFGTSNCGGGSMLGSKEMVEQYISANQNVLKNEISRGNGETLNGLADLVGANNRAQFGSYLKSNYSKIFAKANQTSEETTQNLFSVMY
jgi:hypothetical protein